MKRRDFLAAAIAAGLSPLTGCGTTSADACTKSEYHVFSRVFQFLRDPYKAAELIRSCGYDGVEWTVRPGGFLEPSAATPDAMKRLKAAAQAAGLKADNLVVSFLRGDEPGAEALVMAAAEAGFTSFRGAYFKYDRAKTHRENFAAFQRGFDTLAALARKSGMKACYQNHSTYNKKVPLLGSLVWDLAAVVKDYDPKEIGIQYDPMHVRAEGGPSWDHTLGAIAPWIDIVCLKDFYFTLNPKNPKDWRRELVPAGQGIVDFAEVKRLMALEGVRKRYTVHFDYKFPESAAEARKCAADDLKYYRSVLESEVS